MLNAPSIIDYDRFGILGTGKLNLGYLTLSVFLYSFDSSISLSNLVCSNFLENSSNDRTFLYDALVV